jgi:hypothetical protein
MKQNKLLFIIRVMVFCIGLSIFSQFLPAEDFTVIVPIVLKNLPADVVQGALGVSAWAADGSFIGNNSIFINGHFETFWFDITGGNYSNTVTVKFNADPSRDPRQATQITAHISLRKSGSASGNWQRPSVLLGTTGTYAQIDMTQPFMEYTAVLLVNP